MEFMRWNVSPILISFAGIQIHWYGAIFATAVLTGFYVMKWVYIKESRDAETLDTLLFYMVVGIVVGARLGHCLFYNPGYYLADPIKILAIWQGGLASHGAGVGIMLAVYVFNKKYDVGYMWLLDRLTLPAALSGVFIRTANFVNSEILGAPTNFPLGVIFSKVDNIPRHPVQLYEAFAYLCLFIVLLSLYRFTRLKESSGFLFGFYLCLMFIARFSLEFFKEPQAAYLGDSLITVGQMLSLPFFALGVFLMLSVINSARRNAS